MVPRLLFINTYVYFRTQGKVLKKKYGIILYYKKNKWYCDKTYGYMQHNISTKNNYAWLFVVIEFLFDLTKLLVF